MLLFVASFGFFAACQSVGPPSDEQVVARVGTAYLTLEQIRASSAPHIWESDSIGAIISYRDRWINSQVMYQEALRLGLDKQGSVRERLNRSEREILAHALQEVVAANAESDLRVEVAEIQEYYEKYRDQFVLQERHLRVRHLAAATLNESREAKAQLMRGIEWEIVVDRFALNKEETLRRANQFYPESVILQNNPPMREYLRLIGISEISPIRGYADSFHFIQIVEDRPRGDHPDIDWMFDQIREWLLIEKTRRLIRAYEQNLLIQAQANNEIVLFDVHNDNYTSLTDPQNDP